MFNTLCLSDAIMSDAKGKGKGEASFSHWMDIASHLASPEQLGESLAQSHLEDIPLARGKEQGLLPFQLLNQVFPPGR